MLQPERERLHVSDDSGRIAMVETLTVDGGSVVSSPADLWRYQYSNHLGSAALELDGAAAVISYEEYHPDGTSSYRAVNTSITASAKRYTGKERDEEMGLSTTTGPGTTRVDLGGGLRLTRLGWADGISGFPDEPAPSEPPSVPPAEAVVGRTRL